MKSGELKRQDTFKNRPSVKNLHFMSYLHETRWKLSSLVRALVRVGATGATASFNFGQRVHAHINFRASASFTIFVYFFLPMSKSCTHQLKYLTRALLMVIIFNKFHEDRSKNVYSPDFTCLFA